MADLIIVQGGPSTRGGSSPGGSSTDGGAEILGTPVDTLRCAVIGKNPELFGIYGRTTTLRPEMLPLELKRPLFVDPIQRVWKNSIQDNPAAKRLLATFFPELSSATLGTALKADDRCRPDVLEEIYLPKSSLTDLLAQSQQGGRKYVSPVFGEYTPSFMAEPVTESLPKLVLLRCIVDLLDSYQLSVGDVGHKFILATINAPNTRRNLRGAEGPENSHLDSLIGMVPLLEFSTWLKNNHPDQSISQLVWKFRRSKTPQQDFLAAEDERTRTTPKGGLDSLLLPRPSSFRKEKEVATSGAEQRPTTPVADRDFIDAVTEANWAGPNSLNEKRIGKLARWVQASGLTAQEVAAIAGKSTDKEDFTGKIRKRMLVQSQSSFTDEPSSAGIIFDRAINDRASARPKGGSHAATAEALVRQALQKLPLIQAEFLRILEQDFNCEIVYDGSEVSKINRNGSSFDLPPSENAHQQIEPPVVFEALRELKIGVRKFAVALYASRGLNWSTEGVTQWNAK